MILVLNSGRITHKERVARAVNNPFDLICILRNHQVDTLVCGGNNHETRELLLSLGVSVIDNVACSVSTIAAALERGTLRPGYGLLTGGPLNAQNRRAISTDDLSLTAEGSETLSTRAVVDCLDCEERSCLKGESCRFSLSRSEDNRVEVNQMLESAADISYETERTLCRVAELVYFFLEMKYKRIGIAFCSELLEQTRVLAGVLRRFFEVFAVCCKVGEAGADRRKWGSDVDALGIESVPCNPLGQAEILKRFDSQVNVIVGLCVGVDCVFTQASSVPVTTLFVKDRMLANNPIGAVYSDYYLAEIVRHKADF